MGSIIYKISVIVLLLIIIALQLFHFKLSIKLNKAENRYFATTENGRLIPMTSLSGSTVTYQQLIYWVDKAIQSSLTLNRDNYRKELKESANLYFSQNGWHSFTILLEKNEVLERIKLNNHINAVSVTIKEPTRIIQEEVRNGERQWTTETLVEITSPQQKGSRVDLKKIKLVIARSPRLEQPNGIAIAQWSVEDP